MLLEFGYKGNYYISFHFFNFIDMYSISNFVAFRAIFDKEHLLTILIIIISLVIAFYITFMLFLFNYLILVKHDEAVNFNFSK